MLMSAEETHTDRHADRCIRGQPCILEKKKRKKSDATTFWKRRRSNTRTQELGMQLTFTCRWFFLNQVCQSRGTGLG